MDRATEVSRPYTARTAHWTTTTQGKVGLGVAGVVALALVVYAGAGLIWGPDDTLSPAAASAQPASDTTRLASRSGSPRADTPLPGTLATPTPSTSPTPTAAPSQTPVSLLQSSRDLADRSADQQPSPPGAQPSATPPATAPGRPAGVDVTRPDLTPAPNPTAPGGDTPPTPGAPGAGLPEPSAPLPNTGTAASVRSLIEEGDRALAAGNPVQARALLSRAYVSSEITRADQSTLRDKLSAINEDLLFSPRIVPGDPMSEVYSIASGDSLVRVTKRRELAVDWRLIQRVNRISDPGALKIGQKLKLIRGPFHAIVHKADFRLDLFHGSPDEPERWQYIRSFRVGLGEGNSTPVGAFTIRSNSKLVNPHWVNPRTGEKFDANDPKNPIGEYWLGWDGVGDSALYKGYGLHGTIEPDSIGQQKSMGCVRMGAEDIKLIYELLVEQISTVKVVQ
jgi:hypothetical protein